MGPTVPAQSLVIDLDPSRVPIDGHASPVGEAPTRTAFSVSTLWSSELWWSDGTTAGTASARLASGNGAFVLGDRLCFLADGRLWRSLSSGPGFEPIADTGLALLGDSRSNAGRVFFLGAGPASAAGLWVTDGTSSGTTRVSARGGAFLGVWANGVVLAHDTDIVFTDGGPPQLIASSAQSALRLSPRGVLFERSGAILHADLVTSQTTTLLAAGTLRYSNSLALCALGTRFLFSTTEFDGVSYSAGLYVTDGSAAGTQRLATGGATFGIERSSGGRAILLQGGAVLVTDGTAAGTSVVGFGEHQTDVPVQVGDRIVWRGTSNTFVTDGTPAGTRVLSSLPPTRFVGRRGSSILLASSAIGGPTLFATDGTTPGTRTLLQIPLQRGGSGVLTTRLARIDDRITWAHSSGANLATVHVSDGTAPGTRSLGVNVRAFHPARHRAYAVTPDGRVLSIDPTTGTSTEVFQPMTGTTQWENGVVVDDDLTFVVRDGTLSSIWTSRAGATAVQRTQVEAYLDEIVGSGRRAFIAFNAANRTSLYAVDPAHGATSLGSFAGTAPDMVELGGRVQFRSGSSLVVSDGTAAGTTVWFGPSWPRTTDRTLWRGGYYGWLPSSPVLMRLDPTGSTATPAVQLDFDQRFAAIAATADRLLLVTVDQSLRTRLVASDGTPANTSTIVPPQTAMFSPAYQLQPVAESNVVLFSANDGETGVEPWVSDGTAGGTRRLADLEAGPGSSHPVAYVELGTQVLFAAQTMALGSELWRLPLAELEIAIVAPFGRGCGGVALSAEGRPLLGGAFTLRLDTGVAGAPAATWFDRARTSIPFAGCEVLTLDGLGVVQGWADAHGQFRIPIHVPPLAGLVGLSLFSQGLALVPQLALANGVEVMIGSR